MYVWPRDPGKGFEPPSYDPVERFAAYNRPIDLARIDHGLVRWLDKSLPDARNCTPISTAWTELEDSASFDVARAMLYSGMDECKWGLITSRVVYKLLEDLRPEASVKGLMTGQVEGDAFQEALRKIAEEDERGYGGMIEYLHMSRRFSREAVQAINIIPQLWDYASSSLAQFYRIPMDRPDIWKVLNHRSMRAFRQLREHIRFRKGKNPYERVLKIRNMDQHSRNLRFGLFSSLHKMQDPQFLEHQEARIARYLDYAEDGYRHFVQGYEIMAKQMNADDEKRKRPPTPEEKARMDEFVEMIRKTNEEAKRKKAQGEEGPISPSSQQPA